jgi:hypothetical protein
MKHEAAGPKTGRIELWPCPRGNRDARGRTKAWQAIGKIRRDKFRSHTDACTADADGHTGDEPADALRTIALVRHGM